MRTFLAIELPEKVKKELSAVTAKLVAGSPMRPTQPENLHLTVIFLGDLTLEQLVKAKQAVEQVTAATPGPLALKLATVGFFPCPGPVRGIWVEVADEAEGLFGLSQRIRPGLASAGLRLSVGDQLGFKPHVTLARGRSYPRPELVRRHPPLELKFLAESIDLLASRLASAGPVYTKLAEFRLK